MSMHLNVVMTEDLYAMIDQAAVESQNSKGELFLKALLLYLVAHDGSRSGLKIGLVEPESGKLKKKLLGYEGNIAAHRFCSTNTMLKI